MTDPREQPDRVPLPERFETRARFGPFPSGSDALKFLFVSALGALVALRFGALWWTPFLAAGFLVSVHRREGLSLDERAGHYLAWRWRRRSSPGRGAAREPPSAGSVVRLADGRWAGVFEADGIPVAFLPTEVARRVFDTYRQLLRQTELPLEIRSTRRSLRPGPFLPLFVPSDPAELRARAGYQELVLLLARQRHRRRCRVVVFAGPGAGGTALAQLHATLDAWTGVLGSLDIGVRRLRGPELAAFVFQHGAGVVA